jgi:hypothetical protein
MVDTCWADVAPFLEKACKHTYGRYNIDDVRSMIEDETGHLWVAYEVGDTSPKFFGAVVTQFNTYPQCKYLSLVFCGGVNWESWHTPIMNLLRAFARDMHCVGIEATARKGWSKLLARDGYTSRWVAFELPISGV